MSSLIKICPWPGGKRWVYSITFDEALADLHRFVIPILEAHDVPGHVEVVVGQMGQIRSVGSSTYNGMRHMNADELKDLLDRGWGVGNHSWTHTRVDASTAELELGRARQVLEEAIGEPVTVYCSPGCNSNMNEQALAACRRYGYLGAMSITDALNRPDDPDLLWMNRTFLHSQAYEPFHSEFDPYRNVMHAQRQSGWIIDYLHCPLETAMHLNKDCSADQLRQRIEAIVGEGGDEVWLARVEDAIDYRYTRRHARIVPLAHNRFRIEARDVPEQVRRRTVTLSLPCQVEAVDIGDTTVVLDQRGMVEVDLSQPRTITLSTTREVVAP